MENHTQNTISRRHFLKQMGIGVGLLSIPTFGISSAFALPNNNMLTLTKIDMGTHVTIKASRERLAYGFSKYDGYIVFDLEVSEKRMYVREKQEA